MSPRIHELLLQVIRAFEGSDLDGANLILQNILQNEINSKDAIYDFGIACAKNNKLVEAATVFTCLQAFRKDDARIAYNLGFIYSMSGHHIEALNAYDLSLKLSPNDVDALINKANILHHLKRYEEALFNYDRALSLMPELAVAWSNKGITLHELKQFDEAITHYDKALNLVPTYADAWLNKGNVLYELKRHEEALAHYDKALQLDPNIHWVQGQQLHIKMKIVDWAGIAESVDSITKKVIANERVSEPFNLLALSDDGLLHKRCAEIYVQSKYPPNSCLGPFSSHVPNHKIRVGYFSADFHNHATAHLMAELFELHDKSQFELVGFSFGPITDDPMRKRVEKCFDRFIEVGSMSDVGIAQLSRNLNIDIAIDLKGFTQHARTGIFAYRAAPIQVNYLGYPGTMGADYIDYIIADKTIIPLEFQANYTEKIVHLPHSYQVNDRKRLISQRQSQRTELGLPDVGFVYCCFNNNYKILPEAFASWMKILKATPGSVLWLFQDNILSSSHLQHQAQQYGINPSRLIFAQRMSSSDHLARHKHADLFLDTFPYNAHTTASDALWAGLPVLTLLGKSFAGRVAGSLLNAVGLPDLIAHSAEEYEALAIELAVNSQKLNDLRTRLVQNRLIAPLFDTPLFTRNLEAAYKAMVRHYRSGLAPDHISVA